MLAIQDTTSVRAVRDGPGIAPHPTIAVKAGDGAVLGLLRA